MSVSSIKSNTGYLGPTPTKQLYETMIIDGYAHKIHTITAHTFTMGDVDDFEIYVAQPLWEWQKSEMGKWVMEHAVEAPTWHRQTDYHNYGHRVAITAKLKGKDHTYWQLKWGTTT